MEIRVAKEERSDFAVSAAGGVAHEVGSEQHA